MDAFTLLETDHEKVAELFDSIEASDETGRAALFAQVKKELDIHSYIEETIFYPALKSHEETRSLVGEAVAEHAEVKQLLKQLADMPVTDENWMDTFGELRNDVEHHVVEEEDEMFVQARAALSPEQITSLGQQMEAAKNQQKTARA